MKFIDSSASIMEQTPGLNGIYEAIELAGRTCYKSEDKITDTSAKEFVDRMLKSGHGAMLEFGTVYLILKDKSYKVINLYSKYNDNKYSRTCLPRINEYNGEIYITTNYRVIMQGGYDTWDEAQKNNYDKNWLDDLKYLCEPTEYHEKRICARFYCSIAISRELNRHRVNSIAEMSTRYCNFSKDKFGNEVTFIKPEWFDENIEGQACFIKACEEAEDHYFWMIEELNMKPQQARDILPLSTMTEVNHCAFVSDWKHFFNLRSSHAGAKGMHPDMDVLANQLYDTFKNRNFC